MSDPAGDELSGLSTPWSVSAGAAADWLDVSPGDGLAPSEAERRLEMYGANRLREAETRSAWAILVEQFKSLVVLLLTAAGVASFLFGHIPETIAIGVVLVLNAAIGFFTEYAAVRSMEALRKMGDIQARVRRGGTVREVHAHSVVPGDLVELRKGDVVPADCRVVSSDALEVDESSLTGESVPVSKSIESVPEETELADRTSMLYRGTVVSRGAATGLVVATGMETELGEISELVHESERNRVPLEDRLDALGRKLVWVVIAVAALVGGAGLLAGRSLELMLETSIALAVAAVPEGLPIVATVALSYGMWRMKRQNALIRRLPSVETLGAATRICTDKTGTLTENDMHVSVIATPHGRFDVDEEVGAIRRQGGGEAMDVASDSVLRRAVETAVLANELDESHGEPDPMEQALVDFGEAIGWTRGDLLEDRPLSRTVPFDTDVNMMATIHEVEGDKLVCVKGAPEAVVDHVESEYRSQEGEAPVAISEERRQALKEEADALAAEGFRVLGLAQKRTDEVASPYSELVFLGLVGLIDPPRPDVSAAIDECHQAGVRTVMVTGDHPATAQNVAGQIGLVEGDDPNAYVGDEIEELAAKEETDRRDDLLRTEVLARVTPKQKMTLIDTLQESGEVVAMTGDGVNDAPALKSADIGVAMGERGTEVAREAADMVLLDDAFPTVVDAIRQGRTIFENIRKFVVYLLSGNIGEIALVGAAAASGAPIPLLPLQILYLNVLNDVFPALALGVGPGSSEVMEQPPRSGEASILGSTDWWDIGVFGLIIAACVGGGFWLSLEWLEWSTTRAVTASFLGVSVARLLHVFNIRDPESSVLSNEITRNPHVWGAIALDIGLLALAVYTPVLADVLKVAPPGVEGWLMVGAMSVSVLVLGQLYLAIRPEAVEHSSTSKRQSEEDIDRSC